MPIPAEQVLQQEFLLARAKILELAATLDRIQRAGGNVDTHPQMQLLCRGFEILLDRHSGADQTQSVESQVPQDQRAQQVQLLFSRPYASDWRTTFQV